MRQIKGRPGNFNKIGWNDRILWEAISSPHHPLECPQCHWQDWICTVLHLQRLTIVNICNYALSAPHCAHLLQAKCTLSDFYYCELTISHYCVLFETSHNCVHLLQLKLCIFAAAQKSQKSTQMPTSNSVLPTAVI